MGPIQHTRRGFPTGGASCEVALRNRFGLLKRAERSSGTQAARAAWPGVAALNSASQAAPWFSRWNH